MRAITPPCFEVPAKLAWRKTSPERSTPGPLPYHIPNTPSNLPSPRSSACCAYELLVEAAERRATIAGDIAGCIEARPAITLLLHEAGADQGLVAGHEDMRLAEVVLVVKADRSKWHGSSLQIRAVLGPTHIGPG